MSHSATTYAGAKAPEKIIATILKGSSDLDLSTVTAASMSVVKPDKTTSSWTAAISGQTTTQLVATHTFASDGTDVASVGVYMITVLLTVPTGQRRATPFQLDVF